ncbi:hypothetical protein BaRGS_00021325 [Batillaria attramentaria]|uniref:C-type lectin domain-containing protein n=1 Tax=Batillaria attramentaria TaxID=370345 RepID=A0ABD0KK02_9CAEN
MTQGDAREVCRQYGMLLWEPRSQDTLDLWNSRKSAIFALLSNPVEPWIGLIHDGFQNANLSNFRWVSGEPEVTWAAWASGEPDNLHRDHCFRIRQNKFGSWNCDDVIYSALCVKTDFEITVNSSIVSSVYVKVEENSSGTQRVTKHRHGSMVTGDNLWLMAPIVPSASTDLDSCVLACHEQPPCVMVVTDPLCRIFFDVTG